jgi:hypothetical protein
MAFCEYWINCPDRFERSLLTVVSVAPATLRGVGYISLTGKAIQIR